MEPVVVSRGDSPLILTMPHVGIEVPPAVLARLNDLGRTLADADWHVDRLYDGLVAGATVVRATFHRYVIDANRAPDGASLYPGQNTTGLVPSTDFDGRPIWQPGMAPDEAEVAERLAAFHQPYHAALAAEIERVKALHGLAVVYDCHSIRSRIPFLFEGKLPDFNLGTNGGKSADPAFVSSVREILIGAEGFTHVVDGRFRGGWTTRHYGDPEHGVHALQMELAQSTYLFEEWSPFLYNLPRSEKVRRTLGMLLKRIEALALERAKAKKKQGNI